MLNFGGVPDIEWQKHQPFGFFHDFLQRKTEVQIEDIPVAEPQVPMFVGNFRQLIWLTYLLVDDRTSFSLSDKTTN